MKDTEENLSEKELHQRESGYVSEEEAISLAKRIRDFIITNLNVPMGSFFSMVDRDTFFGDNIPILSKGEQSTEYDKYMNFYVYRSYPALFAVIDSPNHHYYHDKDTAQLVHQSNLDNGYESYLDRSPANDDEESNTTIHRKLFEPNLLYGLMVVAHEPLHPWMKDENGKYIYGYAFEESIVTYLGYQIVSIFLDSDKSTAELRDKQLNYVEEMLEKYAFILRSFVLLSESYKNSDDVFTRSEEQQQLMDKLKVEFGSFYENPVYRKEMMDMFNNAFLLRMINYTGVIVVKEYFDSKKIDVIKFFTDEDYRSDIIINLKEFFTEYYLKVLYPHDFG